MTRKICEHNQLAKAAYIIFMCRVFTLLIVTSKAYLRVQLMVFLKKLLKIWMDLALSNCHIAKF